MPLVRSTDGAFDFQIRTLHCFENCTLHRLRRMGRTLALSLTSLAFIGCVDGFTGDDVSGTWKFEVTGPVFPNAVSLSSWTLDAVVLRSYRRIVMSRCAGSCPGTASTSNGRARSAGGIALGSALARFAP